MNSLVLIDKKQCGCNPNEKSLNGEWYDPFGVEDKVREFCIQEAKKELYKYLPVLGFGLIVTHLLVYVVGKENGEKKEKKVRKA